MPEGEGGRWRDCERPAVEGNATMPAKAPLRLEVLSREPQTVQHPAPLLFIHGAWHGAWCWEDQFLPYFAAHGYRSYALSLRGHGQSESPKRFRMARIADYVDDVAQVAQQLDQPPIIIAHSMGGLVAQKYLERNQTPAAVLLASVPAKGVLRTTLHVALRHPIRFARANLTWTLYPLVDKPKMAQKLLFSPGLPKDELTTHWMRLQNESYLAYLDMIAFALPHTKRVKTPMLVLAGERDALFTPKEERATARAYGGEVTIFPTMAHDMMLEPGWQQVADAIRAWLEARGL